MFHPHLHCILAGGSLSNNQTHFKSFIKKVLYSCEGFICGL